MKREIKFRAKVQGHVGYVYGVPHNVYIDENHNNKWFDSIQYMDKCGLPQTEYIESITLSQYTGLKDKNGVEIYEGDILSVVDSFHDRLGNDVKTKFKGFVSFADASFYIKEDVFCHYRWMDYSCEVLGNIHENPELL